MNTSIITVEYDNTPVFFQTDAFINATAIAKKFNKQPRDYLKTEQTKNYINSIKKILLIDENQLFVVKKGSSENGGGTWFHPKLAIDFSRWLCSDFAVWCDAQIENILRFPQQNPEPPTKKALPNGLTAEQQDCIKAMVKARVEILPKSQQAKGTITCWSALKAKFGYRKPETYKSIKPEDYTTALSLIARLQLDGEPEQVVMTQAELLAHDSQVAEEAVKRVHGELVSAFDIGTMFPDDCRVLGTRKAGVTVKIELIPTDVKLHTVDEWMSIIRKANDILIIERQKLRQLSIRQLSMILLI